MKLYTNSDQTAKLIELGLADSIREERYKRGALPKNYSIGELIEMLPEDIEDKDNCGVWYFRNITGTSVYYSREERMYWTDLYISCLNEELIDNLYDMIVKLKEEGVI